MHLEGIAGLEQSIRYGTMEAWVWPRGGGKDTICELGLLWGTMNGWIDFGVFATFDLKMSARRIAEIKWQIEVNEWLLEDYPEVCAPVRALEGAAQRAKNQTVNGENTRIAWGADYIKLPVVKGSAASGAIIAAGSIFSSVRGMRIEGQRPSFCVISDPQTRETAKSLVQTPDIMESITNDFGGLASHDEPMGVAALMTIIKEGDVADQLSNREINPQWHGKRYKAFMSWPEKMELWHQYLDMKRECDREGDETGRRAHRFYLENRSAMDAGAEVYWRDGYIRDKAPDGSALESSAVQHLMNLYYKYGEDMFMTEFQHEPPKAGDEDLGLTDVRVRQNLHGYAQGIVPEWVERIAVGVDVGMYELHWVCLGASLDATVAVLDYGIVKCDAINQEAAEGTGRNKAIQAAIKKGLQEIEDKFIGEPLAWAGGDRRGGTTDHTEHTETKAAGPPLFHAGEPLHPNLFGVDLQYQRDAVTAFCAGRVRWRAVRGLGSMKGQLRYSLPKPKKDGTRKLRPNWYASRQGDKSVQFNLNADYWKLRVHHGFGQAAQTSGSISLFGGSPEFHRRYARHVVAELFNVTENRWEKVRQWNHWLDATSIAMACLDMLGVRLEAEEQARATNQRRRRGSVMGPVVSM